MNNVGTFMTASSLSTKDNGKSNRKKGKIVGIIFLIVGILILLFTMISYLNWMSKKDGYIKTYAYNSDGIIKYNYDNQITDVITIKNYNGNIINLNIPSNQSIELYCQKNNSSSCIFFDLSNSFESSIARNPILSIFCSLFLIVIGLFIIEKSQNKKENINTSYSMTSLFILLLLAGVAIISYQIIETNNYNQIFKQNNVVNANVYSEIYIKNKDNDSHNILAKYNVGNKEYIYAREYYKKGEIEEQITLYYDKNNPNNAVEESSPFDLSLIIIAIVFMGLSFPLFLSKKNKKK